MKPHCGPIWNHFLEKSPEEIFKSSDGKFTVKITFIYLPFPVHLFFICITFNGFHSWCDL